VKTPADTPVPSFAWRRYVVTLACLSGVLIALVVVVNYFVDPDAYFGRNTLGDFNLSEGQFKVLGLSRHPDSVILLGNSKAAMTATGMIHSNYSFFNAGVGGFKIEDVITMLSRVPPSAPAVIVELDFMEFGNDYEFNAYALPTFNWHNTLTYLLSGEIFGQSMQTVASATFHLAPKQLPDGTFVADSWYQHYDVVDAARHADVLKLRETMFRPYRLTQQRIDLLTALRDALLARGKLFAAYLPPIQPEEMAILRKFKVWADFEAWRAQVREIFPGVVDLTDSPYADLKNFYHQDFHFYPNIGAEIIEREVLPHLQK
jgi:hypothetical protein